MSMNWGSFAGGLAQAIPQGINTVQQWEDIHTKRSDRQMQGELAAAYDKYKGIPDGSEVVAPAPEQSGTQATSPTEATGSSTKPDVADQLHDKVTANADQMYAQRDGKASPAVPTKRRAKARDWELFRAQAEIYSKYGKPQQAQAAIKMMEEAQIRGARKWGNQAVLHLRNGNVAKANEALQNANSFLENGFDVELAAGGKGTAIATYRDEDTGEALGTREISADELEDYVTMQVDPEAHNAMRAQRMAQKHEFRVNEQKHGFARDLEGSETANRLKLLTADWNFRASAQAKNLRHEAQLHRQTLINRASIAGMQTGSREKIAAEDNKSREHIADIEVASRKEAASIKAEGDESAATYKKFNNARADIAKMLLDDPRYTSEAILKKYGLNTSPGVDVAKPMEHMIDFASQLMLYNSWLTPDMALQTTLGLYADPKTDGAILSDRMEPGEAGETTPYVLNGNRRVYVNPAFRDLFRQWKRERQPKKPKDDGATRTGTAKEPASQSAIPPPPPPVSGQHTGFPKVGSGYTGMGPVPEDKNKGLSILPNAAPRSKSGQMKRHNN